MQTLTVDLGERAYPIHIGSMLLERADLLAPHIAGQQVLIVTNETVAPLYLEKLKQGLSGYVVDVVVLPDGEAFKTLETLNLIFDAALAGRHSRNTTLIALGGGVVGDMCGFAAASYQRGVNFIQIPTTLLSQVDSSVGGKTGVNHALGKNMIGAFWQPQLVLADMSVLATLPDREFSAGIAEIVKYGLLGDEEFLAWLEQNMPALMAREPDALAYAVRRSCHNKAKIVARDEREGGIRAWLNLGHTFGHAIEHSLGYGEWLHGEAVAAGMCMAADMSQRLNWISVADVARTQALLEAANLPIRPPQKMTAEQFLSAMAVDKKVLDGQLRLVLLKSLGEAVVTADFHPQVLIDTIDAALA